MKQEELINFNNDFKRSLIQFLVDFGEKTSAYSQLQNTDTEDKLETALDRTLNLIQEELQNQVIRISEEENEYLKQKGLEKQNEELQKRNKIICLGEDDLLLELQDTKESLEKVQVKVEKLKKELRHKECENKGLEQQLEKLERSESEVFILNKDKEDEIQLMKTVNKELNEKLDQNEASTNLLKKRNSKLEGLIQQLLSDNKDLPESQELNYIRSKLNQKLLENLDLIKELNTLRKENDDLKFRLLCLPLRSSLSDELSEANAKISRFTQTKIDYDCNQEKIHGEDELLDEGYYVIKNQNGESSTGQSYSEIGSLKTEAAELPVDYYYEFVKKELFLVDRSLVDDKKSLEALVDEWFIYGSSLKLKESQKKLNQELLNSIITDFYFENYGSFSNLRQFLESHKKNEDLKTVLNLKRGHLGTTLLNIFVGQEKKLYTLFIKVGADPNMRDNKGKTLLHDTALYHCEYEDLLYLLDEKVNLNIQDEKGRTPLHYYATVHNREAMNLLINKGADFNIKDNDGNSPLQIAIDNKNVTKFFLTESQKELRTELCKLIEGTFSDNYFWDVSYDPGVEDLKTFLNQHKNDEDLKIVLNVSDNSSVLRCFPCDLFPNVKALLLEAGAVDFIDKKQENHKRFDVFLSEFYQSNESERDYFLSEVSSSQSVAELKEVVDEALAAGIKLNFAEDYCFTDYVLKKISQLEENYEIASDILCTLISKGAKLKKPDSLKVIDTIELKFKGHKADMVKAHKEYVHYSQEFFRVAKDATSGKLLDGRIDNGLFYLEYSEDSTVNVAEITNQANLTYESRRNIIKIGKSEVEIVTENGIRDYINCEDGIGIELTFDTNLGKLKVRLYSDKSKIIVEVSDKEEILKKFKNCKEELGKNCLLGGYSVYNAIERGYFKRPEESLQSSEAISTPQTRVDEVQEPQTVGTSVNRY